MITLIYSFIVFLNLCEETLNLTYFGTKRVYIHTISCNSKGTCFKDIASEVLIIKITKIILLEKFVLDCHKWNLGQKELCQLSGCCRAEERNYM